MHTDAERPKNGGIKKMIDFIKKLSIKDVIIILLVVVNIYLLSNTMYQSNINVELSKMILTNQQRINDIMNSNITTTTNNNINEIEL